MYGRAAACRPPHVLLITSDPAWCAPVREAVAARGGVVETVPARSAVARLAGLGTPVSHVLADSADPGGFLETIAALTSDTASAEIALLFLGTPAIAHKPTQIVAAPDRQSVTASLGLRHFPIVRPEPALSREGLRDVIDRGLIQTRYQPIVRLADRAVTAVEVLARLNHPVHGGLTPDWFVPRFEDSGLACALTDEVVARAFADAAAPAFRGQGLTMALNFPLRVLSHDGTAQRLDDMRAAAGLTAGAIAIELTESQPVEDFAALALALERFRALGYRVSIDDAGPAVRNLDRMMALPFTGLKLDKGIVRMLGTAGPLGAQVPGIVERALARGLTVVAEGVESREIWDRLHGLGVREAQGYFIARPLPVTAMPVWREAWTGA